MRVLAEKQEKGSLRLTAGNKAFNIPSIGFAVLHASFTPHSVCLTEAGGPVRSIGCDDGRLQSKFDPGSGNHVTQLHYSSKLNAFFGVVYNLDNKGIPGKLLRFEVTSGRSEQLCDLNSGSWDVAFLESTDQLVTTSGEIRNLSDGALVGQLSFPQREYPDD